MHVFNNPVIYNELNKYGVIDYSGSSFKAQLVDVSIKLLNDVSTKIMLNKTKRYETVSLSSTEIALVQDLLVENRGRVKAHNLFGLAYCIGKPNVILVEDIPTLVEIATNRGVNVCSSKEIIDNLRLSMIDIDLDELIKKCA
ncbi:hypothetical protein [Flammeovirga sp. EKP202]|uniref:hypothetical protein n=1 Tax=Flammeovirga sp. EKP202 TaxID=2770592 RepID=UPI00165EE4A3|nr:hypothetical protein [Flammeovirga sp. EKP202]MBD0403234.1 hypothetical protein [Flammeovirga sp. EKP202]